MTDQSPALTALLDQVLAADRRAHDYIEANGGETYPHLGPVTADILATMHDQLTERYLLNHPVACPHLHQATDLAIWFARLPECWLCVDCAIDLATKLEGFACDRCAAILTTEEAHLNVHIPGHVGVIDGGTPARMAPPTLAKLLLCADCSDRNKTSDDTSTSLY